MSIKTSVWFVKGAVLEEQQQLVLDSERRLEEWIVGDLSLLGEDLLLLDQQVRTTSGPLDVLAIDGEGRVVIAELKRDRTPRQVVAQILDYASWIRERTPSDFDAICINKHRKSLAELFRQKFEYELPEDACKSHRMLIVAAELDDSSERIVRYLQEEHEVNINVVFFSVYQVAGQEMLVRAWLADPVETQERAERHEIAEWSGLWFVNTGIKDKPDNRRDWDLCRQYGFISAGGDEKYSRPLFKLRVGDRIAAYRKGKGYVGIGKVDKSAVAAEDFALADGRALDAVAPGICGAKDKEAGEFVVGVHWEKAVPETEAKGFKNMFSSQHVVCKLRHGPTLDFLRQQFGI